MSNSNRSEKFREVRQEVEKLSSELRKLKTEYDLLFDKYASSEKLVRELQEELNTEIGPNQFRKTLHSLKEETERLRAVYPVEDLLAAKELEVEKTSKALASVTEAHPEFSSFDLRLRTHTQERDELRKIVSKADERFRRQILRIRTAGLMIPFEVHTEDPKPGEVSLEESGQENVLESDIFGNSVVPFLYPL
ncbi:MAG: hypothetical protein ABIQ95_13410 [Bdellovibrionia bacterium]